MQLVTRELVERRTARACARARVRVRVRVSVCGGEFWGEGFQLGVVLYILFCNPISYPLIYRIYI